MWFDCTLLLCRSMNFQLRNKTLSQSLNSLVKTEANIWENSRADQWKSETQSRVFTCSRILTNFYHDTNSKNSHINSFPAVLSTGLLQIINSKGYKSYELDPINGQVLKFKWSLFCLLNCKKLSSGHNWRNRLLTLINIRVPANFKFVFSIFYSYIKSSWSQLIDYLRVNDLYEVFQSVYKTFYSIETALLWVHFWLCWS